MAGNRLSGKNPLIKGRVEMAQSGIARRTSPLAREPGLVLRWPPLLLSPDPPSIQQMEEGEYRAAREDYVIRGGDSPSVSV